MSIRKSTMYVAVALTAMLATTALAQPHGHEGDLIVGRTGSGQLAIEGDFDEAHLLTPVSGLIHGWTGDEPGFDHLELDEPDENFYTLEDGASIYFEVVAFEPAFKAWKAGAGPYMLPGDTVLLGDEHVHGHLDWHIDSMDPAFDPLQTEWQATFRLIDTGNTTYLPSESYTLTFTNVPEPATGLVLLLGGAALIGRRR